MLDIILSNHFKKDLKAAVRRGYDISLLNQVIEKLSNQEPLLARNRDHALTGEYIGFRECHIQPDWLLIYRIDEGDLILFLSRTGSHSDLFY